MFEPTSTMRLARLEGDRGEQLMHRARLHVPVAVFEVGQLAHQLPVPAAAGHLRRETLQAGRLSHDVGGRLVQELGHAAMQLEFGRARAAAQGALAHLVGVALQSLQHKRAVAPASGTAKRIGELGLHRLTPQRELARPATND